jgi:hypothetical protein
VGFEPTISGTNDAQREQEDFDEDVPFDFLEMSNITTKGAVQSAGIHSFLFFNSLYTKGTFPKPMRNESSPLPGTRA